MINACLMILLITFSDVGLLVKSCPNLLELDLSDSLGLTESVVAILYENLRSVQLLHLSRCYYILPESLRYIRAFLQHPSKVLRTFLLCLEFIYRELRRLPELRCVNLFSMMSDDNLQAVINSLVGIDVNAELFSTVARPTVAPALTSIWGLKVRDLPV